MDLAFAKPTAMPRIPATLSKLEVSASDSSAVLRGVASFRAATLIIDHRAFSLHCPADFLDSTGRSAVAAPASLTKELEGGVPCACFVEEEATEAGKNLGIGNGHSRRKLLSSCESRCRDRAFERCQERYIPCMEPCWAASDRGEYNGRYGWFFCRDQCNRQREYCRDDAEDDCSEGCSDCFAAGSLVVTQRPGEDKQPQSKPMEDVRVGDLVLSVNPATGVAAMEPVYSIAHKDLRKKAVTYRLSTSCPGVSLTLTPTHLLYVSADKSGGFSSVVLAPAKDVRVGDYVWSLHHGDVAPQPCAVVDVTVAESAGIINILPMSGTLVVDGTVASAFVQDHADLWGLFPAPEGGRQVPLLQLLAAPLRWLYSACPRCVESLHADQGFALFIVARGIENWLAGQWNKPQRLATDTGMDRPWEAVASCPMAGLSS